MKINKQLIGSLLFVGGLVFSFVTSMLGNISINRISQFPIFIGLIVLVYSLNTKEIKKALD